MPCDGFGRKIDYLRISVIDQCNLRCRYCMPMDAGPFAPRSDLLTPAEIGVVARAAAAVGFRKIRLTGGEPTLRPDLLEIVATVAEASGLAGLSMTTNGTRLTSLAAPLAAAGLTRVNVHIDSLDPGRAQRLMRGSAISASWNGVLAAEAAGLLPIKLNSVVTRSYNDEDVALLAALTRDRAWHVRFIETMPLGTAEPAALARSHHVPTAETRARIEQSLGPLEPVANEDPSDEARNFRLAGAAGIVGFISPVSEPYCGSCNRMRLTPTGQFHLCLLNDDELDVRRVLRTGGGVTEVAEVLLRAVAAKPVGHRLHDGHSTKAQQMFQLGG